MANEFRIEPPQGCCGERRHPTRISFSNKIRLESMMPMANRDFGKQVVDPCFELEVLDRKGGKSTNLDKFFAEIRGLPEAGARWVAERFQSTLLANEPSNGGVWGTRGYSGTVSIARTRAGRPVRFMARVSDSVDPKLQEVGEQVDNFKEEAIGVAQESRVPVPQTKLPFIGVIGSLALKNLACGIIAGGVAAFAAVPFDVVRTRLVAGQGGHTTAQVLDTVFQKEGVQSLLQGSLKVTVAKNAIEKGFQFATYEFVKRYQRRHSEDGRQQKVLPLPRQVPVATAGGAAGGFVGTLAGYPLQPVFDRIILAPEKYKGLLNGIKTVVKEEGGVRELFRGITPALIAIVPSAAVSFYTYETLTDRYLPKRKLTPQAKAVGSLGFGAIAGVVSTVVTYPLELARKEILLSVLPRQAVQLAEGRVIYNNTWQALSGIAKSKGFQGLYRGLPVQTLAIVPMTAVSFAVYELAKMALVAEGEEERDELRG